MSYFWTQTHFPFTLIVAEVMRSPLTWNNTFMPCHLRGAGASFQMIISWATGMPFLLLVWSIIPNHTWREQTTNLAAGVLILPRDRSSLCQPLDCMNLFLQPGLQFKSWLTNGAIINSMPPTCVITKWETVLNSLIWLTKIIELILTISFVQSWYTRAFSVTAHMSQSACNKLPFTFMETFSLNHFSQTMLLLTIRW